MRLFKWLGVLLGSAHIILYFLVPDYFSVLDKVVPMVIGIPFMFACGYVWPLLVFFAFAPRRLQADPATQTYIADLIRSFGLRVPGVASRVAALILLWPFTFINFVAPYLFFQILNGWGN